MATEKKNRILSRTDSQLDPKAEALDSGKNTTPVTQNLFESPLFSFSLASLSRMNSSFMTRVKNEPQNEVNDFTKRWKVMQQHRKVATARHQTSAGVSAPELTHSRCFLITSPGVNIKRRRVADRMTHVSSGVSTSCICCLAARPLTNSLS